MNHVGKIAFKWVYWHMLLPGYLPQVPLLPAHMNFVGKRVDETTTLRHARDMKVADVMTRKPVCATQGSSLRDAAQLLIEHRVSAVPVLDPEGQLIGILSKSDLISALDLKLHSLTRTIADLLSGGHHHETMGTIVDDVMSRDPATVAEDATLEEAAEKMDQRQVHQLVAMHADGSVAGMIAHSDLVRLFTLKTCAYSRRREYFVFREQGCRL